MGLLKASNRDTIAEDPAPDEARLDHADPAVRRRAVQALSGDRHAIETLVTLLRDETDNGVRQAAFLALASVNSAEAAQSLARLLSEADPALRNGALEFLANMPEHARQLLGPLGSHEDPDVRIFGVLLASELHHLDTAEWLIGLAQHEADPNVCSNLAEALGGSGVTEAVPALELIAKRFPDDAYLIFAVETAMQRLGGG